MTPVALRAVAWLAFSLAELPFRFIRAAALAVCPDGTHDVFPEEDGNG